MATDWAADVKKYVANADDAAIAGIVRYCGIALRKQDSALISFSDKSETDRVRTSFLKKKLGLTQSDAVLDKAIAKVGEKMKGDRTKNRVTVYYLLAAEFKKLDLFIKPPAAAKKTAAAKAPAAEKAPAASKSATGRTGAKVAPAAAAGAVVAGKIATAKAGKAAASPKPAAAKTAQKPVAKLSTAKSAPGKAAVKSAGGAVAGTIAAGAAAAGAAVAAASDTAGAARDTAAKAISSVGDAASAAVAAASEVAEAALDTAVKAAGAVGDVAGAAVGAAGDAVGKLGDAAGAVGAAAVGAAGDAAGKLGDAAGAAVGAVGAAAGTAAGAVTGAAGAAADKAAALFTPGGQAANSDDDGAMGWLLWLLVGALLLFALWWFVLRGTDNSTASNAPAAAAPATMDAAGAGTASSAASDLAAAPAEGSVAIPAGAGVTTELRDGKPVAKVYFDSGKTDVVAAFAGTAGGLKAWLEAHPGARLAISGFSDPSGNARFNAELSRQRAEAVKAALVSNGIPADAALLVKPANSADSTVPKEAARRVEVTVQ